MKSVKRRWAWWIGAGSCTFAAAILSLLFSYTSFKTLLPFLFLGVIILVATRFGKIAGILGTLAATLIFATFLFQPTLSPLVEDAVARDHLIWMVLIGIILSDLLGTHTAAGSGAKDKHP